ncbi:putative carboxypeptidase 2, partial [Dissoconium aciculare CBS 342.82]|uniref:Carboxypeptidase 2 n=1 Tax=Dissoconium aciculare CBS 342.82 TaxID=1314786 RepID=A0A6J3M6D3_9PEZI
KTGAGYGDVKLRYREVPAGICELQPGVKSYSGYADIAENKHIFFWFFEARNVDPKNAPLTAWISGGPGDSSMAELFTEHGPCRVRPDEELHYNPFSWNNYSNVIYIDQPLHVGFSYTNLVPGYLGYDEENEDDNIIELGPNESCPKDAEQCGCFSKPDPDTTANSTINAAPDFWLTLQAFMGTFPQYSNNGFHFGSESYGGHYVPVISKYIQDQNKAQPSARHIDLKSILIGNGWFSPQRQHKSFYDYGFEPGSPYDLAPLDDEVKKGVHDSYYGKGNCLDLLKKCEATGTNEDCRKADAYCGKNVQTPWITASKRNTNDVREIDPSPFPNSFYADYLQNSTVREAIGALQTYIELNPVVGIAFDLTGDDARELGIIDILGGLVKDGVKVVLYAGDADYECNYMGVEASAEAVGVPGFDKAGYTDIRTPDCVTHGQVRQAGGLSFVRVYEAGHAAGAFQPLLLQTMFARTIAGVNIASGTNENLPSQPHSTYREGNGTVQYVKWSEKSTYNTTSNTP